jgi:hypothetical protein
MESHMHRCLFTGLLLFLLTGAAQVQYDSNMQPNSAPNSQPNSQPSVRLVGQSFSDLYAAQKMLLSSFCRLDFEGARLQAGGWERFRPYTSLHANPEFTSILIVTRFDIETPEQPTEELNVHFQAVGSYQLGEGYTADKSSQSAEFRVQEQNGSLMVTAVSPESPHVSLRAALVWMKQLLDDPKTDDAERVHLRDAVNQLNALLAPPPSTPDGQ